MYPHDKLDWTVSRLEKRLEDAPDDAAARLELANTHLSRAWFHGGGEMWFNKALTQARRVLQADPSSPGALVAAGMALVGMERLDNAERYLDEAVKLEPERADVHLAIGELLRRSGDRHGAVRELEIACRQATDAWEPNYLLGRLLAERANELGRPRRLLERAQFHLVRALQLGPAADTAPDLIYELAVACLHSGRFGDAHKLFTRLLDHERYRGKSRYFLGLASYNMGKYKNAVLFLRQHLESAPDHPRVHARIGMAYLQLGEVAKAREACNRALAIEPTDLQARWTLGCALLEEGRVDEAIRLYKSILSDAPDHTPAFTELVRIRRDAGDRRWLEQALRAEVSGYDRLPVRTERLHPARQIPVEIDPRAATRERISIVLRSLAALDGGLETVLRAMNLTTEEGMRFLLWEAALEQLVQEKAQAATERLRAPGAGYSAAAGRELLTLSRVLPEPLLTKGLQLEEDDLKRAAVDRHGPHRDVAAHRAAIERERQEARAWQAMLLLSLATRQSRTARNLLVRWASDADEDLADASRAALVMLGDTDAADLLRQRAARRGAEHLVDGLRASVEPRQATLQPRPVSDDEETCCSTCGRRAAEVGHMMAGTHAIICNLCMTDIARNRRELASEDATLRCALSGRSAIDARAMYVYRGVPVSAEVLDNSLGLLEREEIDQYLASW